MTTAVADAPAKLRPHQFLSDPLPPLVQPPAALAHLRGEALRLALVADTAVWTVERVALESGRSKRTVDRWVSNYAAYARGERDMDRHTPPKPTYYGTAATWLAGDMRAWLMRTEKMRDDGTFIPYVPEGRPRNRPEANARPAKDSEMNKQAPAVLAAYERLTGQDPKHPVDKPLTPKQARAQLAETYGCTIRGIVRRCQRGRDLRAGRPSAH